MKIELQGYNKTTFKGECFGLKVEARDGQIMLLDKHSDYITIIKAETTLVLEDQNQQELKRFPLQKEALLLLEDDRVTVFT
jgi:hypothetical protein